MPLAVTTGAMAQCTMGSAPMPLTFVPKGSPVTTPATEIGTVTDIVPMMNIPSFVLCKSIANPAVASATAAALGTLTPMPCVPVPTGPWSPGDPKVMVDGSPLLTQTCMAECAYGGVITIVSPAQAIVMDG